MPEIFSENTQKKLEILRQIKLKTNGQKRQTAKNILNLCGKEKLQL